MLTAFQEVEDSLAAQRILAEEKSTATESVRSAKSQLDLALDRYKYGTDSYLDVTTAQNQLLVNEQTKLSVRTRAATNSVQFVKAIGGSWQQ